MDKKVAVLVFDYGSIRLPPVCYLIGSIIGVGIANALLRGWRPCDKLNLGALGNIVRQLHVRRLQLALVARQALGLVGTMDAA